jgi:hypothetical protein
MPAAGDH